MKTWGISISASSIKSFLLADSLILKVSSWLGNTTSTKARTSSESVTSRFGNHFSIIQSHYAWKFCSNYPELNWNQLSGHKKTKLNICHYNMLTSSTQLENRSFHVVERTRTSAKCQKMKNARAKRAKILFFIVKYANLWCFCCRRRAPFWQPLRYHDSKRDNTLHNFQYRQHDRTVNECNLNSVILSVL